MTFSITLPMTNELKSLPIIDITLEGTWIPCHHNDCSQVLSFGEPYFLAQTTHAQAKSTSLHDPTATYQGEDEIFHNAPKTNDIFHDAPETLFPDGRHYFNPSDLSIADTPPGKNFHLTLDKELLIPTTMVDQFLMDLSYEELRGDHEIIDSFVYASQAAIQDQAQIYVKYLGYRPVDVIRKTLENTSQLAQMILH